MYIKCDCSLKWYTYRRILRMYQYIYVRCCPYFRAQPYIMILFIHQQLLFSSSCSPKLCMLAKFSDTTLLKILVCSRLLIMRGSETYVTTLESVHDTELHHTIKRASYVLCIL